MDAGIIRSFKLKYGKLLIRYVISRVDNNKQASNIINEINILKVIGWVKSAWKEFTSDTMKHCFEKCGFPTDDYVATAQDSDDEFEMLFNEISENCSIDEYIEADNTSATSEGVDVSKTDWREKLRNECIEEALNVETANSELEDEDEDKSQESSSSSIITPTEALSLLNDIVTTIERISIPAKKQIWMTA